MQEEARAQWEDGECPLCSSTRARTLYSFSRASYVRCLACGLVHLRPRLREAAMLRLYQDSAYFSGSAELGYEGYESEAPALTRTFQRRLDELAPYQPRGRLLDVGCGTGLLVEAALARGYDAHGIDASAHAVERAQRTLGARVRVGTLDSARFDEPFDLVTGFDVFEHLYQPRAFVRRLASLLRPGGSVALATPNYDSWLRRLLGRRSVSFKIPEHVAYYDPRTLALAVAEEFRVVEQRWIGQYCSIGFLERRLRGVAGALGGLVPACAAVWLRLTGRPLEPYVPSGSLLAILARR
jgi:2-polyprenyl-3-methyl-5-hydroxy-6-metoxy-1,4-benzoquinol methylase